MCKPINHRLLSVACLLTLCVSARAIDRYRIIELPGFRAEAINDLGQITGRMLGNPAVGAIWEDGRFTFIGSFGGGAVFPADINNAGTVVGQAVTTTPGLEVPFIYQDGSFLALDPRFTIDSAAEDANDRGQIVGTFGGFVDQAFLWDNGVITNLGSLAPDGDSLAEDINNKGQIVGLSGTIRFPGNLSHGFLWEDGTMHDLSFAPDLESEAYEINDLGQIVGGAVFPAGYAHPTIWEWDTGKVIDLGLLPGSLSGFGLSINNHTQVVGLVALGGFENFRPFYWEEGIMLPLEGLLPPDSGWTLSIPRGINNSGQITGWGLHFGVFRSFLMEPIPTVPPADLDGDGAINTLDLGILLSTWSIPPTAPGCGGAIPCSADLNGDGFVNTIDLGMLLAAWSL